jgi:thioredoxin reductase (NADPH)
MAKSPTVDKIYDLIIIGSGPAGLTAAIYAVRYSLKTLVIGQVVGGQVAEVGAIENYPGFRSIGGLELSRKWLDHAKDLGAGVVSDAVNTLKVKSANTFKVFLLVMRLCSKKGWWLLWVGEMLQLPALWRFQI